MATETVRDILSTIDAAVEKGHPLFLADMKQLGEFCHRVVDGVADFRNRVTKLGLPHPDTDKVLAAPLTKCLTYVQAKSRMKLYKHVIRTSREGPAFEEHSSVSMSDLKSEARTAIREGIVEPVLVACERSMRTDRVPMDQRSSGCLALGVLYAIEDMDRVLCFGHPAMSQYERRCEGEPPIDLLVRRIGRSTEAENLLHDKVDNIANAVGAVLIGQETGRCPRLFFMVPHAKSKQSWFKKVKSFNVFHKTMDLHFVCSMFFDDLRTAVGRGSHQSVPSVCTPEASREISPALEVEIPRGFVKRWMPVIKLTLKIVDLIVHAAAYGVGVGAFIPGLTFPEQNELLVVLKDDFESFLETDSIPSEDHSGACWVADGVGVKLLDGSARNVMQKYLDTNHAATWETMVLQNLRIATNKKHKKCAYICVNNQNHLHAWENRE